MCFLEIPGLHTVNIVKQRMSWIKDDRSSFLILYLRSMFSLGLKKDGKLNEAIHRFRVMQNMTVISWTNSWVFASSSRWYAFLPLISFCSSCCASYCLVPLVHRPLKTTVTDLNTLLPRETLIIKKENKSDTYSQHFTKNLSCANQLLLSARPHPCSYTQSKEITDVMQQHPHILGFILTTTFFETHICWDVDGKLKVDFLDEENVHQRMTLKKKKKTEIKMQITCNRNCSTLQEKCNQFLAETYCRC